jgi:transcriptional regulator with XRE-family HTH domain
MQRNWTQSDLAKRLKTSQAVVSRLEDPSYGKYTLQTLMDVANALDVGLQVRLVSFISMFQDTFKPRIENREIPSFEEESKSVIGFFDDYSSGVVQYVGSKATIPTAKTANSLTLALKQPVSSAFFISSKIFESDASPIKPALVVNI